MKWKQGLAVSSMAVVGFLVIGFSAPCAAKGVPGKQRTCTGVIARISADSLILDRGKKGEVAIQLQPQVSVSQERLCSAEELAVDRIVSLSGKGQGDVFQAVDIVLLPAEAAWRTVKKAKKGPAFGQKPKSTEYKAKIMQQQPLVVMNRYQQKISVNLAEKGLLKKLAPMALERLQPGMKVQVAYVEQPDANQAQEILLPVQ
ncbi:hypothetical protein JW933_10950 [candidate division FCPU426 bacterium]|nr:hypothetical protein [candidate division FCPU426 bacterium]